MDIDTLNEDRTIEKGREERAQSAELAYKLIIITNALMSKDRAGYELVKIKKVIDEAGDELIKLWTMIDAFMAGKDYNG